MTEQTQGDEYSDPSHLDGCVDSNRIVTTGTLYPLQPMQQSVSQSGFPCSHEWNYSGESSPSSLPSTQLAAQCPLGVPPPSDPPPISTNGFPQSLQDSLVFDTYTTPAVGNFLSIPSQHYSLIPSHQYPSTNPGHDDPLSLPHQPLQNQVTATNVLQAPLFATTSMPSSTKRPLDSNGDQEYPQIKRQMVLEESHQGLNDDDAEFCINWFTRKRAGKIPDDEDFKALAQLLSVPPSAIKCWFAQMLKKGVERHDSGYSSRSNPEIFPRTSIQNKPYPTSEGLFRGMTDISGQPSCQSSKQAPDDLISPEIQQGSSTNESRNGRRKCTPTLDQAKLRPSTGTEIYQCTRSCGNRFQRRYEWKRHEELAYPAEFWLCSACPKDSKRKQNRSLRKDHFFQHCRAVHQDLSQKEQEEHGRISHHATNNKFPRFCGFCARRFASRQERITHIGDHFKEGKCMVDWIEHDVLNDIEEDGGPEEEEDDDQNSDERGGFNEPEGRRDKHGRDPDGNNDNDDDDDDGEDGYPPRQKEGRQRYTSCGTSLPQTQCSGGISNYHGTMSFPSFETPDLKKQGSGSATGACLGPMERARGLFGYLALYLLDLDTREIFGLRKRYLGEAEERTSGWAKKQLPFIDREIDLARPSHLALLENFLWKTKSIYAVRAMLYRVFLLDISTVRDIQSPENVHFSWPNYYNGLNMNFRSLRLLGTGGFATVEEILHEDTRLKICRKTLKNKCSNAVNELVVEADILRRLRHPHIVRFVATYSRGDTQSLLLSPVADTTLSTWLNEYALLNSRPKRLINICNCLVSSIRYLHEVSNARNIYHGDIKPANILVIKKPDQNHHILLSDFGAARIGELIETNVSNAPMTRQYSAPEAIRSNSFPGRNSDIWSLGCVLLEIWAAADGHYLTFRSDFSNSRPYSEHLPRVRWWLHQFRSRAGHKDHVKLDTIKAMLHENPSNRPDANSLSKVFAPRNCCITWPDRERSFPDASDAIAALRSLASGSYHVIAMELGHGEKLSQWPSWTRARSELTLRWMNTCYSSHRLCMDACKTDPWVPTRLLDIGLPGPDGHPSRLICPPSFSSIKYVAVSWAWADTHEMRLTTKNYSHLLERVTYELIPKPLQRAMMLTRYLGFQYIWVDSLCIIQDSKEDGSNEASKMINVFRNAQLTVVFLAACNTVLDSSVSLDFSASPSSTRRRAYHETVFSKRVVSAYSMYSQMYWECNELKASETFPDGLPPLLWESIHHPPVSNSMAGYKSALRIRTDLYKTSS